jgi:hypothetical protein
MAGVNLKLSDAFFVATDSYHLPFTVLWIAPSKSGVIY